MSRTAYARWRRRRIFVPVGILLFAAILLYCWGLALAAWLAPNSFLWHYQHDSGSRLGDWAWEVLSNRQDSCFAAEEPRRLARQQAIWAELEQLDKHPWAGEYRWEVGDGGESLSIAPQAGFVYYTGIERPGEGVDHWNHGEVEELPNGRLRLHPAIPASLVGASAMPEEYVLVCWGERRYLVGTTRMIEFCNEVNACIPWGIAEFLRYGGNDKPTEGLPMVPEEYRRYLLDQPVFGIVTQVLSSERQPPDAPTSEAEIRITVETNIGRLEGLWPGMRLYVDAPTTQDLKITAAEDHKCTCVLDSSPVVRSVIPAIEVGAEVRTRCSRQRPAAP